MKIYGKETDYYDTALSYGQDPYCKWVRKFKEYKLKEKEFPFPKTYFSSKLYTKDAIKGKLMNTKSFVVSSYSSRVRESYDVTTGYVFFCGKSYPFIKCVACNTFKAEGQTFYTIETFVNYLNKLKIDVEKLFNHKEVICSSLRSKTLGQYLKDFLSQLSIDTEELHSIHNIAIYVYEGDILYEGGCLKDYQFIKVFDPYTCLQELDMYTSGVLGGQSPKTIEISDTDRLEGKGFDKVISFRKRKSKTC